MRVSVGDFLIRRRRASRILITTGCFRGLYTAALLLTTSIMSAVLTAPATTGVSHVHVEIKYIPAPDLSLPALAVQVTRLVDSYMLWAGTTDVSADDVQNVTLQGHLAKDWACAMPARDLYPSIPLAATSLFRSSSSDVALSMAQRLARRFKKQIFLSIDMPQGFDSMGQGSRLVFAVEKALVETLREMEQPQHGA